jgi:hypothetical protein
LPSSAERFVERDKRRLDLALRSNHVILGAKDGLLFGNHIEHGGDALVSAILCSGERSPVRSHGSPRGLLAMLSLRIGRQRVVDVVPSRKHRLMISDRRFALLGLAELEIAFEPTAFEKGQGERRAYRKSP